MWKERLEEIRQEKKYGADINGGVSAEEADQNLQCTMYRKARLSPSTISWDSAATINRYSYHRHLVLLPHGSTKRFCRWYYIRSFHAWSYGAIFSKEIKDSVMEISAALSVHTQP